VIIRTAPPSGKGTSRDAASAYEDVDVLNLTSSELQEQYGVLLGDFSLQGSAEVIEALVDSPQRAFAPDRLNRLFREVDLPQPCFLGWQEGRGAAPLPFLTDGSRCGWSLFFEPDDQVATVTYPDGAQQVTRRDLPRTEPQPRRGWRPGPALGRGWSALKAWRRTAAPAATLPGSAQAGA